ncbi:MAG: ATP-binding cassette domain-containing protein [Candidatus Nezhaarchaeales archaeon]
MFSIYDNVAIGPKLNGIRDRRTLDSIVERSLKLAGLWDEVKDDLNKPATSLSGGQQQRLCIARALAVEPEVLLMDEPTSSLDPISAAKIEQLIRKLAEHYTIVVVTHNLQQAARISDYVAFLYLGELVEYGPTKKIFKNPESELTWRYISGVFS